MAGPFGFIDVAAMRPRAREGRAGLTMVVDGGIPLARMRDGLELAGDFADIVKVKVGSARLYTGAALAAKVALCRESGLGIFPGGQFLEYALHMHGVAVAADYFAETARLGFTAVEISDNVVRLSDAERLVLIGQARAAGLAVYSEVGAKHEATGSVELIRQAQVSLDAGADLVLVEAAEFVAGGAADAAMIAEVTAALDMARVMIELPGPWIPGATPDVIEDMKKALIRAVGPGVNLGNVAFDDLLDLECARVGLGTEGPPGMRG
ncbi:MAG: phosphosulfolactate synthase [Rhodobacteraceae bacterium]|jgi:phosphosulfolactate synthase|nr:phosphosulfolactate synthase [Paracoccaceae bacterium]